MVPDVNSQGNCPAWMGHKCIPFESRIILCWKYLIAAATYWREDELFISAGACVSTWFIPVLFDFKIDIWII